MPLTSFGAKEIAVSAGAFCVLTLAIYNLSRIYQLPWLLALIAPLAAVFLWVLWFFRDPSRPVPTGARLIVSPADGTVTHLDEADEPDYIGGAARRCSIFLSVFDVHLNRAPASGVVEYVKFRPGSFFDARREESLVKNQNKDIGLAVDEEGLPAKMVVRQSSGLIARNIVCPVATGAKLKRGQRYGMIKFGSRTTLLLSMDADIVWKVKVGDKVRAGETILAVAADKETGSGAGKAGRQ